jgi:hypothetical protein
MPPKPIAFVHYQPLQENLVARCCTREIYLPWRLLGHFFGVHVRKHFEGFMWIYGEIEEFYSLGASALNMEGLQFE